MLYENKNKIIKSKKIINFTIRFACETNETAGVCDNQIVNLSTLVPRIEL